MGKYGGREPQGICQISGKKYPRRRLKKTWDGLWVGPEFYDNKHPQLDGPPRSITDSEVVKEALPYGSRVDCPPIEAKNITIQQGSSAAISVKGYDKYPAREPFKSFYYIEAKPGNSAY